MPARLRAGSAGSPWLAVARHRYRRDPQVVQREVIDKLGFPVFVKPSNGGSSVGVSRAADEAALARALAEAFRLDAEAVVEQGLDAREIECAVLGNDEPRASCLGEIVPSREFYDYNAKYVDGTSELTIPADLPESTREAIRAHALAAYGALRLRGLARVDFLLERSTGNIFLSEANTLPGFTPISMFPKLWEASDLPYPELIERLVDLAFEGAGSDGG